MSNDQENRSKLVPSPITRSVPPISGRWARGVSGNPAGSSRARRHAAALLRAFERGATLELSDADLGVLAKELVRRALTASDATAWRYHALIAQVIDGAAGGQDD